MLDSVSNQASEAQIGGATSEMEVDEEVSTIKVTNDGIIIVPVPWPCKGTSSRLVVSVNCRILLDSGNWIWIKLRLNYVLKCADGTRREDGNTSISELLGIDVLIYYLLASAIGAGDAHVRKGQKGLCIIQNGKRQSRSIVIDIFRSARKNKHNGRRREK